MEDVRQGARRTRQRILRKVTGTDLERPAIVDGLGVCSVDIEQRPRVHVAAGHVAIERTRADRQRGALPLPRQLAR